jgi:anti-sigma factor RsiW
MTGRALPKDLNAEWAWSQIEACADGSLRGSQQARMRQEMARDPMLAAAVARAREVRTALGSVRREPVPAGLRARLLTIGHPRPIAWRAVAPAALGVATVLLLAVLVLRPMPETPGPTPQIAGHDESEQAIEEFRIAMRYLRIGAERSGEQVGDALATSLRLALATSHDSLREHFAPDQDESHESNGG